MQTQPSGVDSLTSPDDSPLAPKPRLPLVTTLECGICVIVFLAILASGTNRTWDDLAKWGYLSPNRIWGGAYWGLITAAFVHLAFWHIALNLYWFWILGNPMEAAIGRSKMLAFTIAAAFVSSAGQLATSGSSGHGASGIIYAILGFLWIGRKTVPAFDRVLGKQVVPFFLIWLVGCIVATVLHIYPIANGAHVLGLCFGIVVGFVAFSIKKRKAAIAALLILITASCVSLFWCPWNAPFVANQGVQAHNAGDYQTAVERYRRSVELGVDRKWALANIALAQYSQGDSSGFASTLSELRRIDPRAAQELEEKVKTLRHGERESGK